jgi:hypothetical protein
VCFLFLFIKYDGLLLSISDGSAGLQVSRFLRIIIFNAKQKSCGWFCGYSSFKQLTKEKVNYFWCNLTSNSS